MTLRTLAAGDLLRLACIAAEAPGADPDEVLDILARAAEAETVSALDPDLDGAVTEHAATAVGAGTADAAKPAKPE